MHTCNDNINCIHVCLSRYISFEMKQVILKESETVPTVPLEQIDVNKIYIYKKSDNCHYIAQAFKYDGPKYSFIRLNHTFTKRNGCYSAGHSLEELIRIAIDYEGDVYEFDTFKEAMDFVYGEE